MRARLIAYTSFDAQAFNEETGFAAEGRTGSDLAEAAGRLCYLSWDRPNPATATNAGYIANIIDHQHFSVLEHGTATFLLQGISRNVTHELIRHRPFSVSEVSQRYVPAGKLEMTTHPLLAYVYGESDSLDTEVAEAMYEGVARYERIVEKLKGMGYTDKKAIREAARGVLPGLTETKIVVTGNYRIWRHFINMRGSVHADAAIREVALKVAEILKAHAPNVFADVEFFEVDNIWCVRTKIKDEG